MVLMRGWPTHGDESRGRKGVPGSCEKIISHSERSEESAFIFLNTDNCRFFASLRMTGLGDSFTRF
jgi:hypothetical protein